MADQNNNGGNKNGGQNDAPVVINLSQFTDPGNIARMAEGTGEFVGTIGQACARGAVGFATGLFSGLFGNGGKKDQ